jgi:prefoldin subunit 5
MKYIAEKKENDEYLVTAIKEMETVNGDKVEVKIDSKSYIKKSLEECIEAYSLERDGIIEKYNNDIKDMNNILEAINKA